MGQLQLALADLVSTSADMAQERVDALAERNVATAVIDRQHADLARLRSEINVTRFVAIVLLLLLLAK